MITREYCIEMARYNAWQNNQLHDILNGLTPEQLCRDHRAFFGSIIGTASHLVWGDAIWMSRFDGGKAPVVGIPDSAAQYGDLAGWWAARESLDARIQHWAAAVETQWLQGDMTWFSGAMGREVTKPRNVCVTHMFNHQTHHRGQIHAMLTASGAAAPVSDLFYMPEDRD